MVTEVFTTVGLRRSLGVGGTLFAPVQALAPAFGDGPELLHINVEKFARSIALVALDGLAGRPGTAVESAKPLTSEDPLDG